MRFSVTLEVISLKILNRNFYKYLKNFNYENESYLIFKFNSKKFTQLHIDFLFKEEFLWEKSRKDVKEIKEFALTILMENEELNKRVNLTYEFLECIVCYI